MGGDGPPSPPGPTRARAQQPTSNARWHRPNRLVRLPIHMARLQVYRPALKEPIHEEFGDGI